MKKEKREKFERRRVRSSYVSVVVSTSLVLLILGLTGLLVLSADRLSRHIKENFAVGVTLKGNVKAADKEQFIKSMEMEDYVKRVNYVSREDAMETLKEDLGEDFVDFVGENPLSDKIEIFLKADYARSSYIDSVKTIITENEMVSSVDYNKLMIDEINANIRTISLWLVGFAALFLVISVILINNSIRLAIYSKRFTIKTMQLVGATQAFISRPFIVRFMVNGLLSAAIAIAIISGLIYYLYTYLPEYRVVMDFQMIGLLYVGIVLIAGCLTFIGSSFALKKFLGMHAEDLYY
ncbi:MAG: permease-like cell division protein FtsX [Flavobacteriales bacterium]|nr:permease-like cell division protein FtsX [Flavobacteriales bacterium]